MQKAAGNIMKAFFYVSSKALHIDFRIWEVIWFIKETVLRIFPKLLKIADPLVLKHSQQN